MRLSVIGKCMLEIAPIKPEVYRLNYGGDVMNTAVYLARARIDITFFYELIMES